MPTFCRHNRFVERCPICRQTLAPEGEAAARRSRPRAAAAGGPGSGRRAGATAPAPLRVHRAARPAADGYRSALVPGLHASLEARRLADEVTFASARLDTLSSAPPGPFGEAAADPDRGRATRLVLLTSYLSPVENGDPFAGIRAAWPAWERGALPDLADVPLGPRTSHEARRGTATLEAYLAWESRVGSAEAGIVGDPAWSPQRRFERAFERLALPGLRRGARYDFLVVMGRLSLYDLRPPSLALGEDDDVLLAAKRVFGIGDRVHLERRAGALAQAAGVLVEALDVALFNWERGERASLGVAVAPSEAGGSSDGATESSVAAALGL